ncbi:hypothetical protein DUNSADRAFT_14854, partial [Dunaliella salina]
RRYRNIFQISKQQEAKVGSQGLVLMAKHLVSGNLTALKFHKQREARDFSAEVLRGLVSARKVVATIPPDLPASDVIFDDEEKYPDYPYCLVMEGGVEVRRGKAWTLELPYWYWVLPGAIEWSLIGMRPSRQLRK